MKERRAGTVIGRIALVVFTTLLLIVLAVVGVVFVILRGPSESAQELLTRSLKETSAIGFIPDLFLPPARVAEIMRYKDDVAETQETDVSLVTITATHTGHAPDTASGEAAAESGGGLEGAVNGIRIDRITGANYKGVMMLVEDPMRMLVGTPDSFGAVGLTLEQMIEKYDAIAGINAGAFYDPNGTGMGGTPEGIVISGGAMTWGSAGTTSTVIGFDDGGILHVGRMTGQEAMNRKLQWACSFGPALIINGEPETTKEITSSSVNPRTAIGQRADGTVLLLVVDGRQVTSLGATFEDLISIFLDYGAVNAANLDGGSSSKIIYEGAPLNDNASVIGTRPLPTSFLVRR